MHLPHLAVLDATVKELNHHLVHVQSLSLDNIREFLVSYEEVVIEKLVQTELVKLGLILSRGGDHMHLLLVECGVDAGVDQAEIYQSGY